MSAKLYINKENLKNNIKYIKSKIDKNVEIIAMVKANGYGAGMNLISHFLESIGISNFGVALVQEGKTLRKSGIKSDILVTSQFLETDFKDIIENNLTVSVSNIYILEKLNEYAKSKEKTVKIHIKIDSGMGRLGFDESNVLDIVNYINENLKNICIDGIYTHLSSADTNEEYTLFQLNRFDNIVTKLINLGYHFNKIHALNSAGVLKYSKFSYTHVRTGILMYGYMPDTSIKVPNIKPCLTLKAPILRTYEVKEDSKISYGGTYIAKKGSKIATIAIGYADGLSRACSNNYNVYIGNTPCKIIGNICMDMCMIDITNVKENLNIGDEVTIFSKEDDVNTLASLCNTINYEIISRLNERIERILI